MQKIGNMNYNECLSRIIRFNGDKELLTLREKYNEPSFFEIISKERSETTFSSFLKWLFSCSAPMDSSSPIMLLLDILVRRSVEQKENVVLIQDHLKKGIVSRKLKIQSLKVETEQPVSALARVVFDALCVNNIDDYRKGKHNNWSEFPAFSKSLQIASNCQDRIDLFIDCDILDIDGNNKKLQIIIENKVDSKEGSAKNYTERQAARLPQKYVEASQTGRYYMGTHREDNKAADVYQLYVYLTPMPSSQLDNFNSLRILGSEELRDDEHFIQINYQDILDGIITPLLHSSSLSTRSRFFLEEFKNELTYPNVKSTGGTSFIAVSEEASDMIARKWEVYEDLVIPAALTAVQEPIWYLDGTYFNYQPKAELLSKLLSCGKTENLLEQKWIAAKQDRQHNKPLGDSGYYYQSRAWYRSIESFAQQANVDTHEVDKYSSDVQDLLSSFWEEHKLFLSALMHGLPLESRKSIQCIIDSLAKRDTSKYLIYYADQPLCDHPLNNAETVWRIAKKWIELQQRQVTLDELNAAFPRKISHYYETGKYYINLFVQKDNCSFDGENGNKEPVPENCWDIDRNGKYDILLNNSSVTNRPQYATLLKMWRREDAEAFIRFSKEKPEFKDNLSVVKER
jgi:hypothetical protein